MCRDGYLSTADPAYSVCMCKSRRTPRYVKKSNGLFLPTKVFFSPRSQAFFNPMAKNWSLESLAIGPISHATDFAFWHDAFQKFPAVPRLKELTIVYYYSSAGAFDERCWTFFNNTLCRLDTFPRAMRVDIRIAVRSSPLSDERRRALHEVLLTLRRSHTVTFWGRRE